MRTVASAISVGALIVMAFSMWSIASDMHEIRWTLIATSQKASW